MEFFEPVKLKLQTIKFSTFLFYIIVIIGLAINIGNAILPPNFLHPDEIYQSLEVAHKLVYGYGILSWEWVVGSWQTPTNPSGYGPIRSMITPLIFALIFILGNSLNLNYWGQILPLIRIFLVLNFLLGLYIASKLIKELNSDKKSYADKIFFVFALFYQDLIFYGSKSNTTTLVIPFLFFPLLIWVKSNIENRQDKWALEVLAGFFVGISIWVRPDTGIVMAFFVLLNLEYFKVRKVFTFGIGFLISFILDGVLDLIYYGKFFITFINFIQFNTANQSFFGVDPFGWYFKTYILDTGSLFYLFILITLTLILYIGFYLYNSFIKKKNINTTFLNNFKLLIKLTLWTFLVLFWWETQPHKEERFMIAWEITYLILGSFVVDQIIRFTVNLYNKHSPNVDTKAIKNIKNKIFKLNEFRVTLFIIVIVCLPFATNNAVEATDKPWNNFKDLLQAFIWVGQHNVTGVAVAMPLYYTGGYTFLHRNVTIYYFDKNFFAGPTFIPHTLALAGKINYLIIPKYRYSQIPDLYNSVTNNGFILEHVVFGSTDIWYI